jgi:uncharacterized peroxidase-related enzyme
MPLIDYVDPETDDDRLAALLDRDAEYYDDPSLFALAMANNPDVFDARSDYHRRLVEGSEFDTRLAELVYLTVSVTNDCEYCVASHREQLVERVGVPESDVTALAQGEYDGFSDRERAVVELAEQTAMDPNGVDTTHRDALYDAGFDDGEIVRLLTVAAAAIAANTLADALNIHPTDLDGQFT